jgi:hypothetical protein
MAQSTTSTPPNSMRRLVELMAKMNPYTAGEVDDMDLYISHPTTGAATRARSRWNSTGITLARGTSRGSRKS